jgi:glycosyltransferase involved in cell wall biosynthesis
MEELFRYSMAHLSVVLPVLNESSLIDELIKRVKSNLALITEDYEIILIDDGSEDQTWELIEKESRLEKRQEKIDQKILCIFSFKNFFITHYENFLE